MSPVTLSVDSFLQWLQLHPNCIVRAGTPEVVLFDDEELHWQFFPEGEGQLLVQLLRGKHAVGELLLTPEQIAYVQGLAGEQEGEFVFELVTETDQEQRWLYFFVMSHGYDDPPSAPPARVH